MVRRHLCCPVICYGCFAAVRRVRQLHIGQLFTCQMVPQPACSIM